MSYYCPISFRHCDSLEKGFSIAHKLCNFIRDNTELVERLIKNNSNKIPSNWRGFERKRTRLDECFFFGGTVIGLGVFLVIDLFFGKNKIY